MLFPELVRNYLMLGLTPGNFVVSQAGLSFFRESAGDIMKHAKPWFKKHFTNGSGNLCPYYEAMGSAGGSIGSFFKKHPDYAPLTLLSLYGTYRIQQRFFGFPPPRTSLQRLKDGLINEKEDFLSAIGDNPVPTLCKTLAVAGIGKMIYDYCHKPKKKEKKLEESAS